MDRYMWIAAELLVNIIEVAGIQWYLHRMLGTNKKSLLRVILGGLVIFLALSLINLLKIQDLFRLPIILACWISYSLFVTNGQLAQKIFQPLLVFLILGVSDLLAISVLTLLPGFTFDTMSKQSIYRLEGMVASKTLFISLIFFLSIKKTQGILKKSYWILFCTVPIISSVVLGAFIQYESMIKNASSYWLFAASFGIFVLNVIVLVLIDRLSDNIQRLLKQEITLQQAEQQHKYFKEIEIANENMRGFRHDIKNHLQILGGLLYIKKVDKARAYLSEIGAFIQDNDFLLSTGHLLIDAVLGSKFANARKQGIDVKYTITLFDEIMMTQMDLCSILGNILDNAIEACDRITDGDTHKYILLAIGEDKGYINITLKNSAIPASNEPKTLFKTSKKEEGHGIGLANAKKIVRKYNGLLDIDYKATEFVISIKIPVVAKDPT